MNNTERLRNIWFSDYTGAFVMVDDDGWIIHAAELLPATDGLILHVGNPATLDVKYSFGDEWSAQQ